MTLHFDWLLVVGLYTANFARYVGHVLDICVKHKKGRHMYFICVFTPVIYMYNTLYVKFFLYITHELICGIYYFTHVSHMKYLTHVKNMFNMFKYMCDTCVLKYIC